MVGLILELLDVALFDAVHQFLAAEEIFVELAGDLPGYNEKLVVGGIAPGNRPSRRDQMRTPLKHKAQIPEDKTGD